MLFFQSFLIGLSILFTLPTHAGLYGKRKVTTTVVPESLRTDFFNQQQVKLGDHFFILDPSGILVWREGSTEINRVLAEDISRVAGLSNLLFTIDRKNNFSIWAQVPGARNWLPVDFQTGADGTSRLTIYERRDPGRLSVFPKIRAMEVTEGNVLMLLEKGQVVALATNGHEVAWRREVAQAGANANETSWRAFDGHHELRVNPTGINGVNSWRPDRRDGQLKDIMLRFSNGTRDLLSAKLRECASRLVGH